MIKTILPFLLIMLMSMVSLAAVPVQEYANSEFGFMIKAPTYWEVQKIKYPKESLKLDLLASNREAQLRVLVSEAGKSSAADYLKEMEGNRKLVNNLSAKDRVPSKDFMKRADVEEGLRGRYEIKGKGPQFPVAQEIWVLKSKNRIYTLIGTIPVAKQKLMSPVLGEAFRSFRVKKTK